MKMYVFIVWGQDIKQMSNFKVSATLQASLNVDCPKCEETFDAFDQDNAGDILTPIFYNAWDDLIGCELSCPYCKEEIELTEIIW